MERESEQVSDGGGTTATGSMRVSHIREVLARTKRHVLIVPGLFIFIFVFSIHS